MLPLPPHFNFHTEDSVKSVEMPSRKSSIHTSEPITPRRSQRLLLRNITSDTPKRFTTPPRPEDLKSFNSKSRRNPVCFSNPSCTEIEIVSLSRSHKDSQKKSSRKSSESHSNSRNCTLDVIGLRRSSRLNNGLVDGFRGLRRSTRLSHRKISFDELKDCSSKGAKKPSKPDKSRRSARVNSRSQRHQIEKNVSSEPYQKANNRVQPLVVIDSDSDFSVEGEGDQVVARKAKVGDKSIEKSSGKGEKMTRDSITREKLTIEGRAGKGVTEDVKEDLARRKRKRSDQVAEAIVKGWTKEQELALQRAYFAAKPTPHFWKKVSKLVPGKSEQDCFERINQDITTPPQAQPRSRAKTTKSSPLESVSLSASMLLKPTTNKARRSSCLKFKSHLTQKSLRELVKRHRQVGEADEGDLFSVLEPDVNFSTPKQLNEKQGWLQSCTGTSSSSHKKSLSRCETYLVSPPVLKQVKNRVNHEKYINQLRCREARRRAASARVQISKTEKAVREEGVVQKKGVELAKIALMSEAKDAIDKFQHSQANLTGLYSPDEEIEYGIGAEDFDDEDESQ